jgi:hypothetical protein
MRCPEGGLDAMPRYYDTNLSRRQVRILLMLYEQTLT